MTEAELLLLWGKTCREKDAPEDFANRYHPLFFHLLDVAHATLALWDNFLTDTIKKRIAKALGCDVEKARILVAILAGLHDLGKASPGFQFQETSLDWLCERLQELGLHNTVSTRNEPHNFISSKELKDFWLDNRWRWKASNRRVAPVLAHITGAHHGTFPNSQDFTGWKDDVMGGDEWKAVRMALIEALIEAICPTFTFPETTKWEDVGAIPILAGLISVADWIGSSYHFEPVGHRDGTPSIGEYLTLSQERVNAALDDFGFAPTPQFAAPLPDFTTFWGFTPNPLQEAVLAQVQNVPAAFLLVCEAPMGSGKTESALTACDAAFCAEINEGFYIALPTQATSNAMYKRARKFLDKRLDTRLIHLQLVHGNAGLLDTPNIVFKTLTEISDQLEKDPGKARIMALSWFTGAKRPLLAPFGVGTIDQSLLAALQTRHFFVRLFGLAGKVVVFDEVHAYDTYMSGLLTVLLHWLKELGCSVILLSATLPSSKRRELLEAWGTARPELEAAYPRLTWCEGDQKVASSIAIKGAELAPKTVTISRLKTEKLVEELREKLSEGGCAAIICNTVADAQTLFLGVREAFKDSIPAEYLLLFHARLPFKWRQQREDKVKELFGDDKTNRPKRAIIISTQVIEQSLDIDLDYMVSYVCPTDLLLQRVGRLHRHPHTPNRYSLTEPQLAILTDAEGTSPPNFGASEWVYEREVLLRSWLQWREKPILELPAEIESLIENTYEVTPEAPDEEWQKALNDARDEAEIAKNRSQESAKNVVVNVREPSGKLRLPTKIIEDPSRNLKDDEDPNVHQALRARTREGDEAVTVICLCKVGDKVYLSNEEGRADLKAPVDFSEELKKPQIQLLMDFAVSLSQKGLTLALLQEPVPATWKKSPVLRHIRPLYFMDGAAQVGDNTLHLDGALGIVIEKPKKETGAD